MHESHGIGIAYLGTRGGGAQLTKQLKENFRKSNVPVFLLINDKNEILEEFYGTDGLSIFEGTNHKWVYLFSSSKYNDIFEKYVQNLKMNEIRHVLITMTHPLNLQLIRILKLNNIKVISLIHDYRRHPGDYWPTKRFINQFIADSDVTISLSSYVNEKIKNKSKRVILSELPSEEIYKANHPIVSGEYCLFIGRIRKYKGLSRFIKVWQRFDNHPIRLVVAGEGRAPRSALSENSILVFNKWLSNEEMHSLVANASFVILPYTEASQSGILMIASAYNKPCLITPVGGLSDYQKMGHPCIIAKTTQMDSIEVALQEAFNDNWVVNQNSERPPSIIEIIIDLIAEE